MNASPNDRITRALSLLADVLLGVCLFTEIVFAHTVISQAGMLLFVGCAALLALRSKRIFGSWWMACAAVMILWGAVVSLGWAADRSVSLSMVLTLAINAVFFFFLFQYLMLRGDMRRYLGVFVLAVLALTLYLLARAWPIKLGIERLGIEGGVNPNTIGMLCAYAFGMCVMLAGKKRALWWLLPMPPLLAAALLSMSVKAAALAALLPVALLLVRFPRRWGWKLAGLIALGAAAFYFVVLRENPLSTGVLQRVHAMARYLLDGSGNAGSLLPRVELFSAAWAWFLKRPFGGWGIGCFYLLDGSMGTYSHCNYTELLVSGGIPMALLYYVPQLFAFWYAARALKRSKAADPADEQGGRRMLTRAFAALLAAQIVMDIGMVSYFERTSAVFFVLAVAAARLLNAPGSDGARIFRLLANPCILFVELTHHGFFRRMPDELYLRLLYRGVMGKKLHLNPPVTYNEKIQWLKLHDKNPLYPQLCDKLAVRDFVRERVGDAYFVPILGVWDDPDDIDFSALPERFVLKCTHDSGGVILCMDRSTLDADAARRDLKQWLKRDYSRAGREWAYKGVPRRVLAEEFIGHTDGSRPDDIKLYCFRGKVFSICVCTNRRKAHADYLLFDRELRPYRINDMTIALPEDFVMPRPPHFDEMVALAERLSAGLLHVRVDLYDTPAGIRFGEMTLYDQSGLNNDFTYEGDKDMGKFLPLEEFA